MSQLSKILLVCLFLSQAGHVAAQSQYSDQWWHDQIRLASHNALVEARLANTNPGPFVTPDRFVIWVPVDSHLLLNQSARDHMIKGGHNTNPDSDLYVCRVHLKNAGGQSLGIHPGKLLANQCNVSYGGHGTEYQAYDLALWSIKPGYWAGDAAPGPELIGGVDSDGTPLKVCSSNWIEQHSKMFSPNDHGRQIGKWVKTGDCMFEYGGVELDPGQDVQFYHLADPPCPAGTHGTFPTCTQDTPCAQGYHGVPPNCQADSVAPSNWSLVDNHSGRLWLYVFMHPISITAWPCSGLGYVRTLDQGDVWPRTLPSGQVLALRLYDHQPNSGCDGDFRYDFSWNGSIPGDHPYPIN